MLSHSHRQLLRTKGVVVGRILIALLFFGSGLNMLLSQTPTGVAGYFDSLGLPMAGLLAWLVIILKIGAGGALLVGKRVGLAASSLAAFTLAATLVAHADMNDPNLFKNLAVVGGLLYVLAFGPGHWKTPVAPQAR